MKNSPCFSTYYCSMFIDSARPTKESNLIDQHSCGNKLKRIFSFSTMAYILRTLSVCVTFAYFCNIVNATTTSVREVIFQEEDAMTIEVPEGKHVRIPKAILSSKELTKLQRPIELNFGFIRDDLSKICLTQNKDQCDLYNVEFDYGPYVIVWNIEFHRRLSEHRFDVCHYRWSPNQLNFIKFDNSHCEELIARTSEINLLLICPRIKRLYCEECRCEVLYKSELYCYFKFHVQFYNLWKVIHCKNAIDNLAKS